MENVVNCFITKSLGCKIENKGTFSQVYALIHFVYDNKNELMDNIDLVQNKLIVYDENGKNMVNKMLKINEIKI